MWRQVFWQKCRVMRQKIAPSACHEVWQAITLCGRWCTRSALYRVVCANAVFYHDASPIFPVQRRQELRQKAPLPSRQRAGKNAHRSRQTPRQLMRRRCFALCLLTQELTASGDRNAGGKTTLILTINRYFDTSAVVIRHQRRYVLNGRCFYRALCGHHRPVYRLSYLSGHDAGCRTSRAPYVALALRTGHPENGLTLSPWTTAC